jgi:threonylcarbamoyladenosine tRNA methylthiotransferase MtaB
MKRVAFHTLGCKVNFTETSTIGRQFITRGFQIVDDGESCDVFVLNTCSVTGRADRECRQLIRRALRHSPGAYVVVIGCYAQLRPGEIEGIEGVDLVLGTDQKFSIFDLADGFQKRELPQSFVSCIDESDEFVTSYSGDTDARTRAFLKIQDGCDYTCSFCTIPKARGVSRSQSPEQVVAQARELVERGFREIVLTGVNVGDFGRRHDTNLLSLLGELDRIDGLERIRISSIEPNLLTPGMVDFILGSQRFCNHFHIPLQSGSDTILKSMRRRYLTTQYENLVRLIHARDRCAAVGADVLVGFPGETDGLFEESAGFITDLPISYLHVFSYSERPGTPASEFQGAIEPRIRSDRSVRLRELSRSKRIAFQEQFIGKNLPVLFERTKAGGMATGLTENYIRVDVPSHPGLENSIVSTHIERIAGEHCIGSIDPSPEAGTNAGLAVFQDEPTTPRKYAKEKK